MIDENNNLKSESEFLNESYFFFPVKVTDKTVLNGFMKSSWFWETAKTFPELKYILSYASKLSDETDKRLFKYSLKKHDEYPLCLFNAKDGFPKLNGVSLYISDSGVSFIEFHILYGNMDIKEIEEFIYLFRSLRNDENSRYKNYFKDGEISVKTMILRILPPDDTKTEVCFLNPSETKKQACVYTKLSTSKFSVEKPGEDTMRKWCYLISKGYNDTFCVPKLPSDNRYELSTVQSNDSFWGGSQDGLVCITRDEIIHQQEWLSSDYRYLYLLLLIQRFSMISYIDEISDLGEEIPKKNKAKNESVRLEKLEEMRDRIVTLKTRYSFRIISDDYFVQTVYYKMYDVLMIDELMSDIEESNEQLNSIVSSNREKNETRMQRLLVIISLLAVFSALVDFADYINLFKEPVGFAHIISLITVAVIIIVAIIHIYILPKRKK